MRNDCSVLDLAVLEMNELDKVIGGFDARRLADATFHGAGIGAAAGATLGGVYTALALGPAWPVGAFVGGGIGAVGGGLVGGAVDGYRQLQGR